MLTLIIFDNIYKFWIRDILCLWWWCDRGLRNISKHLFRIWYMCGRRTKII